MSKYHLLESTDKWLTRTRIKATRESHLYPSEASVKVKNGEDKLEVIGSCQRSSYLRASKATKPAPYEARSIWIMTQGKIIENEFIARWKEMGIWVENNIKFYWPQYNLSGEVDTILAEPSTGDLFGVEVKTFYGYDAHKNILGNKSIAGFPKESHLMQTILYAYYWRESLKYFKLVYFARDDVKRREFNIGLVDEGNKTYPVVDGAVYRKWSVQDLLSRYKSLQAFIDNETLPPRDYELIWSQERVEKENQLGNISKTAYLQFQRDVKKGRTTAIGDWRCRYCNFKSFCWKSDGTANNG